MLCPFDDPQGDRINFPANLDLALRPREAAAPAVDIAARARAQLSPQQAHQPAVDLPDGAAEALEAQCQAWFDERRLAKEAAVRAGREAPLAVGIMGWGAASSAASGRRRHAPTRPLTAPAPGRLAHPELRPDAAGSAPGKVRAARFRRCGRGPRPRVRGWWADPQLGRADPQCAARLVCVRRHV
jgi:hypothetical protein